MERYLVKVCGRVQGVGFRYFAEYTAASYDLTGYVENCDDGTVRMEIQGQEPGINDFLAKIRKGNTFVRVDDMVTKKLDIDPNERRFRIKY
ncbi:acylphosphatase [Clostridium neuense]|uniref:acylphosphatase n=1 Tax=Clostridium neuense TaxID=1728934 RepID=A0ABW8TC10_9CLOT